MRADTLSIGELSQLTGVPVRTIRFYCDEGFVESVRSTGGHRRFLPDTVERLMLLRRLRALGLGLTAIDSVLGGRRSIAEVAAQERAKVDVELATLAWRRASLRAVEQAAPVERAARLELLAAVTDGRAAQHMLEAFWSRIALPSMSEDGASMFISVSVPEPPNDPTPEQVVAYATLVAIVDDHRLRQQIWARTRTGEEFVAYQNALLDGGIAEACELARPCVRAGEQPGPGPLLDRFVEAHATTRGRLDSLTFRRALLRTAAVDRSPSLRRYWELVGDITGEDVTVGEAHSWLLDSLDRAVA
ncbi:MerR family transcriptional regulator [Streptomyces bingchenggensis BCW-1]|uniref:MerR family transcriptional regulator n=1 Tax=Streptomyces bingchenggensis (strain BCW-1) TaxID=749414 RepID=D7C0S6_STRBB|nr:MULTISPECIES: MerR family transcriptional regulator [Streptomyces]ADI05798.1 MerR family transcriptional regulator [Streptomyces bingchenggensis BCW-1]